MNLRFIVVFLLLFLLWVKPLYAEDSSFKNDYVVEYFVTEGSAGLDTNVKFTIKITNLTSTEYVDKVALAFPEAFKVSNIAARDNKGSVSPELKTEHAKTMISMKFNDPSIGRNSVNTFNLEFNQENLFKAYGNIWEVMLPTISNTSSYQIIVHLPNNNKKIAIAKPKPDIVEGNRVVWNNVKDQTIYAVFGDKQYYKLDLQYHLENSKLIPVYQDVALPPDTLYQKVFIETIKPQPTKMYTDEDGNLIARYTLKPKQKLDITYNGSVRVQSTPRDEVVVVNRAQLSSQKPYLTKQSDYWKLDSTEGFDSKHTPKEIYSFILDKLEYNHERLKGEIKRMGASYALKHPSEAVCTEFTDTFIALARHSGIYTREMEGYGFSHDDYLRPLSLVNDVLHAWPEYYDSTTDLWKPIDPTWEDTSGIDYFSSFDLNHIVFAIHGKDPDFPYPAGSYKLENSKDITVQPITEEPEESHTLVIKPESTRTRISDRSAGTLSYIIKNNGNAYRWSLPVEIHAKYLKISNATQTIDALAPMEVKTITFSYTINGFKNKVDDAIIVTAGEQTYTHGLAIVPKYFIVAFNVALLSLAFVALFFLIKMVKHFLS